MTDPWTALAYQATDGSLQCLTVGLIVGLLVLVLAILMAYQRYAARKRPVQRVCAYCGRLVGVVSDCHRAPIRERFPQGVCLECRKACRLMCGVCGRPVSPSASVRT